MRRIIVGILTLGMVASTCWQTEHGQAADLLTIGSDAPELNIEHWVQDGKGKFKPVTKFEKGKVYVVEFWATWCGPCVASMPHLAETQKKLADKGVQIVSISDEELSTVDKFLDRETRQATDEKPETFRDLTSYYCLTTDPDRSSHAAYMDAAYQDGIPTSFIVGKDGKIEWIGHPMEFDEPLNAVVEGKWDREGPVAKGIKAELAAKAAMSDIFALLGEQKFDEAIKLIDKVAPEGDNMDLNLLKLRVFVVSKKTDAGVAFLKSVFAKNAGQPEATNILAWNIYEMAEQSMLEKGAFIDVAMAATAAAAEKSGGEEKASVIDTLAHLTFFNGDLDKAIELETAAAKLAGARDKEFIEGFLKELLKMKEDSPK